MKKRDFDEMISYFCQKVSEMNISRKCKMELLGMITAIEMKHDEMVPKWIPVSEALPEVRNVVLITAYWHETYQVMQASYFGSDWWCVPFNNCGKHMQKLIPIAWMPLPEPYEVTDENASRNNQ